MGSGLEERNAQWARVRGRLRSEFGDGVFRSWLKPMTLAEAADGMVKIAVPTRFMRDWVMTHLRRPAARPLDGRERHDPRSIDRDGSQPGTSGAQRRTSRPAPARRANGGAGTPAVANGATRQRIGVQAISAPLDPRFTFDNFVVGKPNEFAYAAAVRVADVGRRAVQPAVPLWRRRPRQDPSDARDRLADPRARSVPPGDLPVGREVHVPVHPRAAVQGHDGVQGAVPLRRRADDRRRPVHLRQGLDAGRVLPHLQRAGRPEPAGRDLRRQVAVRPGRAGGAPALAPRLGPGRRHPPDDLRAAPRHPAEPRPSRSDVASPPRCWSSWRTRSPPTCASWKGTAASSPSFFLVL